MLAVLRQALDQNSFGTLHDYMVARSRIPRCKGGGIAVAPQEGFSWFQLSNPNPTGQFEVCQACYEDYIVPANFAGHFSSTPIRQPQEMQYECDLGWPLTKRLITTLRDWNQIVSHGLHRNRLPRCAGAANEVDANSRSWFKLRSPDLDPLWMCEACYGDLIAVTSMDQHMYQVHPPPGERKSAASPPSSRCALPWRKLSGSRMPIYSFEQPVSLCGAPPCVNTGIQNGIWYSLNPPAEEVDICAACYAGLFEASGAGHFLIQKRIPPGQIRVCNLNLDQPRALVYYRKLDQALRWG